MIEMWDRLMADLSGTLPQLLAALGILVVGWLIATLVAKGVRSGLRRTRLDDKLASLATGRERDPNTDVGRWVSQAVFYVLMLFVVVAVLQALHLNLATEPLNRMLGNFFAFLPNLIGGAVLFLVAFFAAKILRRVVHGALSAARLDEKVSGGADAKAPVPLAASISEAVYWFVFLLFLPAILGALQLDGLLRPVQNMFDDVIGYLPKLIAAALIGFVGWMVAGIVRRIVTNLLVAAGIDRLGHRIGLEEAEDRRSVSGVLGLAVYVLILVPVLISALNALELDAITGPATDMLYTAFDAVPLVLGAGIVLAIAYVIARVLAGLLTNFLQVAGFDNLLVRMGLMRESGAAVKDARRSPSVVAGHLALWGIMLFALIEASSLLGFEMLARFSGEFLAFAVRMLTGAVVFALGFWLANVASGAIRATNTSNAALLARVTHIAIVLFAAAIGLRRMGLANDIINLAFGLLIGAVAVATAIAFGIGGREIAAAQMKRWVGKDSATGGTAMSRRD